MPVESSETTTISCDNPACPGHPDLDPADRSGWLFVTHEVYGQPTQQNVFGSYECMTASGQTMSALSASGQVIRRAP